MRNLRAVGPWKEKLSDAAEPRVSLSGRDVATNAVGPSPRDDSSEHADRLPRVRRSALASCPENDLHSLMARAQAAQQAHPQRHDVQLAIAALVASPRKWEVR